MGHSQQLHVAAALTLPGRWGGGSLTGSWLPTTTRDMRGLLRPVLPGPLPRGGQPPALVPALGPKLGFRLGAATPAALTETGKMREK